MADAKKCDICGKYYEHYQSVTIEGKGEFMGCKLGFQTDSSITWTSFDLCQECMTKVHNLLGGIAEEHMKVV